MCNGSSGTGVCKLLKLVGCGSLTIFGFGAPMVCRHSELLYGGQVVTDDSGEFGRANIWSCLFVKPLQRFDAKAWG